MARATRQANKMDAVRLLTNDHEAVKDLFEQFSDAQQDEQEGIAELICRMLRVHTRIEEEIFYPAAREVLDETELVDEAEVEHGSAKALIASIEAMDPTDDKFPATVKVLCEYVDHHVKEEQNELFPAVKKNGMDLQAIGERLAARRMQLMSEIGLTEMAEGEMDAGVMDAEQQQASGASRRRSSGSSQRSTQRSQGGRRHASGSRSSSRAKASSSRSSSKGGSSRSSGGGRTASGGRTSSSQRSGSRRSATR